jgi:dephospho-CoA kinase
MAVWQTVRPTPSAMGQMAFIQNASFQNTSGQNTSGQNTSGQNTSGQNTSGQKPAHQKRSLHAQKLSFGNDSPDGAASTKPVKTCLVGGLTSGIACGKTTVLNMFREKGVPIYDVDSAVQEVWATDDDLNTRAISEFGLTAEHLKPNGKVDTKKLGKIVFKDPVKRKLLESWIHPKVRAKMNAFIEQNRTTAKFILVEVPLLFESKMEGLFDLVMTIRTNVEQQLQRLMNRNGLTQEEAMDRINAQMQLSEKITKTESLNGVILDNSGTLESTQNQVDTLLSNINAGQYDGFIKS